MESALEALGMDQRVDQVAEKADRDDATEDVIEQHWKCPLHAVAGREIGEANAEKAQGQDQPDRIEHVGLRTPPAERDHRCGSHDSPGSQLGAVPMKYRDELRARGIKNP